MKKIIILVFAVTNICCSQTVHSPQKKITNKNLNGIWAENENDNAIFEISNDSIRYVEYYDKPYTFNRVKDTLAVKLDNGYIAKILIVKNTGDSLIIKSDNGKVTRLYKRKS